MAHLQQKLSWQSHNAQDPRGRIESRRFSCPPVPPPSSPMVRPRVMSPELDVNFFMLFFDVRATALCGLSRRRQARGALFWLQSYSSRPTKFSIPSSSTPFCSSYTRIRFRLAQWRCVGAVWQLCWLVPEGKQSRKDTILGLMCLLLLLSQGQIHTTTCKCKALYLGHPLLLRVSKSIHVLDGYDMDTALLHICYLVAVTSLIL